MAMAETAIRQKASVCVVHMHIFLRSIAGRQYQRYTWVEKSSKRSIESIKRPIIGICDVPKSTEPPPVRVSDDQGEMEMRRTKPWANYGYGKSTRPRPHASNLLTANLVMYNGSTYILLMTFCSLTNGCSARADFERRPFTPGSMYGI